LASTQNHLGGRFGGGRSAPLPRRIPGHILVCEMRDLETISLAITGTAAGDLSSGFVWHSPHHHSANQDLESRESTSFPFPEGAQTQISRYLLRVWRGV